VSDIKPKQVKTLQALWHVHASRTLGFEPNDRHVRLKYFSNFCQRPIASTLELTSEEAGTLIDAFKKSLGQRVSPPRRPRDRQFANALGREGRRGNDEHKSTIVDARSLEVILEFRMRLGWTEDEYLRWLASRNSPLGGRTAIRTIGDARSVQWAMKKMLKAKGLWQPTRQQ
jgi:hypothetical protein